MNKLQDNNSQLTDELKVAKSNLTLSEANFEMLEQIIHNGTRFSSNKPTNSDSIQLNILDQLKKLKSQNVVLTQEKSQLEEEFESLSQALFEEANNMVAEARKSKSEIEVYNNNLIEENKSLKSIVKSLQSDHNKRSSISLPMTIPPPPKAPTPSSTSIKTRSSFNKNKVKEDDFDDDLQQSAPIVRPSVDKKPVNSVPMPSQSPPTSRLNRVRQSWFSKFNKSNKVDDDPFDLNEGYGALMSLNVDGEEDNDDKEVLIDNDKEQSTNQDDKASQIPKSPSFPTLTPSNLKAGRTSSFPTIPQLKSFK